MFSIYNNTTVPVTLKHLLLTRPLQQMAKFIDPPGKLNRNWLDKEFLNL